MTGSVTGALVALVLASEASAWAVPRRYALVLGNNHGDTSEATLRYAVADAQRMARVLLDVGGFSPENVQLLTDAEPEAARRALIFLN